MSQELAIYNKIQDPIAAAQAMGEAFAKSGLFGCPNRDAGTVLALYCLAKNKDPFEVNRTFDIVDGKLRKKALAMAAEFEGKGGDITWIQTGSDGITAEAEFRYKGKPPIRERFTLEDAKRQELVRPRSNWVKTPANMLRARVLSNAIAMLCPEIVAGMIDGEEESPTEEPKPLLQETEQKKARKPATVIDIPGSPVPQGQTTAETPEQPQPQSAQEEKPFEPAVNRNGQLTAETAAALQERIGEQHGEAALRWLETKGWIKPKGSLLDLNLNRAKMILNDPAGFLKHIGAIS